MEVPVSDHPTFPEFVEKVVKVLVDAFRLRIMHARSVLFTAFGDMRPMFFTGQFRDCRYIKVSDNDMRLAKYQGVGYRFYNTPAHLLWFVMYHALGPGSFMIRASRTQTLLAVKDHGAFVKAKRWAIEACAEDTLFWASELIRGNRPMIFHRMLATFKDPPDLWSECPKYYLFMACLADVLEGEMPGVVLGALCPQVPRDPKGLPRADLMEVYQWYIQAADPDRPMEWRKQVVRALALPAVCNRPESTPNVTRQEVCEMFPGVTTAASIVRLVRSYCISDITNFPVLIPDTYRLTGDTLSLDRAVCVGPPTRSRRRLPSVHLSKKVQTLFNTMSK